jgi:hypothetical protein
MFSQEDPLHVLGQTVDIGIHHRRIDAKIVKPVPAFSEAAFLNDNLEKFLPVIGILFK